MIPDSPVPRYIFGAGEMTDHIVRLLASMGEEIDCIELFDDGFPARREGPAGLPIIANFADGIELSLRWLADPVMVCTGSKGAAVRYAITRRLDLAGVPLPSIIHPSVIVSPGVSIGPHCVAMAGCILGKSVRLGCWTWLYSGVILEHDTVVGDNVVIGPGVVASGHVTIGLHSFIGAGATIAPGVTIGAASIIGAGAVVVGDIPSGVIAMGVPARVHRPVPEGADAPTAEALNRLGSSDP